MKFTTTPDQLFSQSFIDRAESKGYELTGDVIVEFETENTPEKIIAIDIVSLKFCDYQPNHFVQDCIEHMQRDLYLSDIFDDLYNQSINIQATSN